MKIKKSISAGVLICIVALLYIIKKADFTVGINILENQLPAVKQMGVIFIICLIVTPIIAALICYQSKIWRVVFYFFATLAMSGMAVIMIFPLQLTAGDEGALFIATLFSALAISVVMEFKKIRRTDESVNMLIRRGTAKSVIIRDTVLKTAYSVFFENTGEIFGIILAFYLAGDMIGIRKGMGIYCASSGNTLNFCMIILLCIAMAALIGNLISRWIER